MVRTRLTLRTHGFSLGLVAALSAALCGCAVGSDVDVDVDVDEASAEAESQLGQAEAEGDLSAQGDLAAPQDGQEPDPEPWRARNDQQKDGADPDDIRTSGVSTTPGHHDEN